MLGNAQTPTPLVTGDFPAPGDSSNVIEYTLPATEAFSDSTSANDTLTIDRTLEKCLQAIGDTYMDDIAIGGNQTDTVPLIIYAQMPGANTFHRVYNLPNAFTPGQSSFPTATVYTYLQTADGPGYIYYKNDASGFYELGSYVLPPGNPTITLSNSPAKPVVLFPVDYNSPNNVVDQVVNSSGGGISTVTHINATVDAYGTLVVVSGSVASPIYTTYANYLRVLQTSMDTIDISSGMYLYVESKFYNYYIPGYFDPIIVYSVAKIRNNIDPMMWPLLSGLEWHNEAEIQYNKKFDFTGVQDNEEAMFNLFPNPTNGPVSLDMPAFNGQNVVVKVYDIAGNEVHNSQYLNGLINFDMSDQPAGMYVVNITSGDFSFNSKLILQ
jgi:hypothetical protein